MQTQTQEFEQYLKGGTPFFGILRCLYAIKFYGKRELSQEERTDAVKCLTIIAENECNSKETRAWCYLQLGLIYSNQSELFTIQSENEV